MSTMRSTRACREGRLATRQLTVRGESVTTTTKEFDLLTFLASSPTRVFTRDQLLDKVWHSSSEWQDPGTVTEHVRRLRHLIDGLHSP